MSSISSQPSAAQSISFTVSNTENDDLTITAISSDQTIIPYTAINLSGSNSNEITSAFSANVAQDLTITLSQSAGWHDRVTITVIVSNSQGLTSSTDFSVIVSPPGSGNALSFDGTNEYVNTGTNIGKHIAGGTAITIEYWFKGSVFQSPVRIQSDGTPFIVAGWESSNPVHIISNDGGTNGISCGNINEITNGNWHHLAMTWQKIQQMDLAAIWMVF
ncbi:MAG: hypothetical protein OMM_10368 [Candidatus Magnetoglobus multicellularis str. Araruama]|uniref:Uncharacterized protein n=1 Tax=Candidatus Magnetoglobus multicellularis str. Araruama TaxID=890399 RepID=A0A1V1P148_9BACT|nr:MAG: hypothetical protein OMM_10368 [Candidatus Magnetoglobus multicellularis str. Araruama]